ncbi:hypothetical protein WCD74_17925 [Actinomycetospora sp. OC33-EN08]|uniref:Uncharacterized protein n=1 Tax=Actinomycetospora aurantiaca TaxID=3129233 RepID=A0ABU8MQR6_9PSEU
MDDEERTRLRDLVHRAHEALGEIVEMQARCPADVDRFDWSADLLDGLARVALQVGDAAASLSGSEDDELERRSRELATAIVRRRNEALIPVRMPRRSATRSAAASLLGSPRALT